MVEPVIEHWLVAVARTAGLIGTKLHVDSDTPTREAWILVAMAAGIDMEELARVVATHFRLPLADLSDRSAHVERIVPGPVARRLEVMPLRHTDRALVVASADPVGMEVERVLTILAGRTVQPEVASPNAIKETLDELYPEQSTEPHQVPALLPENLVPGDGPAQHVLVVDDDPDARALLKGALETQGFRVSEASDGTDALNLLETGEPVDLVTLDLQMRELHGLETLKRMRSSARTEHVPVIVATGATDPAVEIKLFAAGADDYVVKPIDPPRFVMRVQVVLRRRGRL